MRSKRSLPITIGCVLVVTLSFGLNKVLAVKPSSATGSGQITINDSFRNFTFTARTDASGVTTGQTEGFNRDQDIRWHGTIDCLSVSGNVATMTGVVTNMDPDTGGIYTVGSHILFQVIDNGEGSKAPPDKISLTFFYGTGGGPSCTGWGTFAFTDIEGGNVQVR